ncbi:hypothetical protein [Sporosalibacterium faouarense]|uniref:hypothetical protein n=1 Tax=Sporosalibacterium faouarense TaxID=516123 RepID=UPI00141C0816|nr:hypothetical protein [Sporosalibacterium faouarense]MTI49559.1 hypothetical protein [Bacillota bacterium]
MSINKKRVIAKEIYISVMSRRGELLMEIDPFCSNQREDKYLEEKDQLKKSIELLLSSSMDKDLSNELTKDLFRKYKNENLTRLLYQKVVVEGIKPNELIQHLYSNGVIQDRR